MATPSKMDVKQEVRFAVVMYGGVSLAIYINGVTQELFRMVRSTAADPKNPANPLLKDEELSGSERVYRRLGQLLGCESPSADDKVVHTQFKIDILSGTSAGGINAVFLSKALANGQPIEAFEALQNLWVEEGDIEKLINDGQAPLKGIPTQKPPKSLLSSQRMYAMLLKAFDEMDARTDKARRSSPNGASPNQASPFVDELDLFVTTTDIRGLTVPLRLADELVDERRHKNSFHLHYGAGGGQAANDFLKPNNPFLAFIARCTSSFPLAFEPMRIDDVDSVLQAQAEHSSHVGKCAEQWEQYFPTYAAAAQKHSREPSLKNLAFGDGGYLDNKPFGYAIDSLSLHSTNVPVNRKLVYIEPEPESVLQAAHSPEKPNVIENVSAGLFLTRYETIREDLQRVLQRNRLVERVDRILSGIDDDIQFGKWDKKGILSKEEFCASELGTMIEREGIAYGGYHRLKIALLTDSITQIIARHAGFDTESDEFVAIRYLVSAWRDRHYSAYPSAEQVAPEQRKKTQNELLFHFDFGFRLRRLSFVIKKIGQLYWLDNDIPRFLQRQGLIKEASEIELIKAKRPEFRARLSALRRELNEVYVKLRRASDELLFPQPPGRPGESDDVLRSAIAAAGICATQLRDILKWKKEQDCEDYVLTLFDGARMAQFDAIADALRAKTEQPLIDAATRCGLLLKDRDDDCKCAQLARKVARYYYDYFDHIDMISLPILYATDAGEEVDTVDVVRISPLSATALGGNGRQKLGGTALANFGGFLERGWRENDILWGRLDGAERIIRTLLAGSRHEDQCPALIEEAQKAILAEYFKRVSTEQICTMMARLVSIEKLGDLNEALRTFARPDLGSTNSEAHRGILAAYVTPDNLYKFFQEKYEVDPRINPRIAVSAMARSTRVVGDILDDIATQLHLSRKPGAWIASLGSVFWGLVEVAIPGSLANQFFRHWLKLVYLFEILALIGGILLSQEVQNFAIKALAITAVFHLCTIFLGNAMHQRGILPWNRWWSRCLVATGVIVVGGLTLLGGFRLAELLGAWIN